MPRWRATSIARHDLFTNQARDLKVSSLLAALNQQFELLLSVPLILEYEAVLTRPQHLAACGLSNAEVGRVLDDLTAVARSVRLASDGGHGYPILMTTWFWKRQ